ncbi:AraC family transcriptional regulator N-terminal domain-containing protein [Sphingomonas sp.]|uniref:AraC family transcriptional regulator n=1 Tax=Sphingomonas sp. TaxID=28214 RepID=UPI003B3B909D
MRRMHPMPDHLDRLPNPIRRLAKTIAAPDLPSMQDLLDRMCQRVRRHTDGMQLETPLPRVAMGVSEVSHVPVAAVYEPMICMVLQGAKQVMIGDRLLRYDAASCFVASIELPATGCVIEASRDTPYVVVALGLNRDLLSELLRDLPPETGIQAAAGFGVAPVTPALLEAWEQLLALLDTPVDIPFLAPAREREVLYRLLQGGHGAMLRQIGREDSRLSRIRQVIDWIRNHFDQALPIGTLADMAGMSIPSFHRNFKAATAMSPLQYQKTLRLQAARRILTTSADAAKAAYAVGYESASQFSREYARLFGAPPSRDRIRQTELPQTIGTF